MMFNLPSGKRGQYMNPRMSYLSFDLEVEVPMATATNTAPIPVLALDGGAHSLFQHLEVYHGSNLLEQIREYNNVHQLMLDSGEITDGANNGRSVSEGLCVDGVYCNGEKTVAPLYGSACGRNGVIISPVTLPYNAHGPVETQALNKTALTWPSSNPPLGVTAGDTLTAETAIGSMYTGKTGVTNQTDISINATTGIFTYTDSSYTKTTVDTHEKLSYHSTTDRDVSNKVIVSTDTTKRTFTFCIPLISGIVGAQMPKYIPVGSLAQDLRLELGIANMEQAMKTIAAITASGMQTTPHHIAESRNQFSKYKFAISNAELQLEYIEVASDVQQAIEASTGGQYVVSFDSFYNFQTTLPKNPGSITQLIGAKFSSIKTVYTTWRDIYGINNPSYPSITSRVNPFGTKPNRPALQHKEANWMHGKYLNGTGWQYMIGSTHYPSKPVQSDQEAFFEAVKAQHSIATQSRQGLINSIGWSTSARRDSNGGTDATPSRWYHYCSPSGTYYTAQNLESQSHKSHLAESGVNTLAQSMYISARFPNEVKFDESYKVQKTSGALELMDGAITKSSVAVPTTEVTRSPWVQSNQGLQLDTIIHYDGILIISNGICTTRF